MNAWNLVGRSGRTSPRQGLRPTFQWDEGASATSITNFPGVSPSLYLSEGHLEKVFSAWVAYNTRSHTDKAHSGVFSYKQTRCQTRLCRFARTRNNLGDFFGRTSDISACAMSEVKLPVMDPRVPNLRQTKQNKKKVATSRQLSTRKGL